MVEFFENHGMLGFRNRPRWRTVTRGLAPLRGCAHPAIRREDPPGSAVTAIDRDGDHVSVPRPDAEPERFDAVVLATHSDQALALLSEPSDRERELLGAIPYQPNEAVLHTDRSLLPRRRRAWASWNYHLGSERRGRSTVTYHMNTPAVPARRPCVLRDAQSDGRDRPDQIIARFHYSHPVYTPEGVAAQARHEEISGRNRTHFCGAYWGWGFHEDGVSSALRACASSVPGCDAVGA